MRGDGNAQPVAAKLEARAVDGVDAIPAWDRLVGAGERGVSRDYLKAWEHVELDGLRSRPIAVRRGDDVVAAVPGYFYDLDVTQMADERIARIVALGRRAWPRLAVVRIFELGCPTALTSPLMHDDSIGADEAARLLMSEAVAEAKRGGAHIVVAEDFAEGPRAVADALSNLGFAPLPIMPTVWLDVPFTSFDEYLGAMRAQYRRRARKVFERSEALAVEHLDDFGALVPEFARLSRQMFDRAQEVKRERVSETFFEAARAQDELSALVLRRPDGSVASFALLLDDRPCLRFLHCGFELDAGQRESAYFRLLYEIVRTAIDGGFERVDFGVTTLAPKLDTGGVPVPLVAWVLHPNPLVRRAFGLVARRMFASSDARPRKVFKTPLSAPTPAVPARTPDYEVAHAA